MIEEIIKATILGEEHLGENLKILCIGYIDNLQQENSRLKEELEELKHKHYLIQGGRGNGKTYLLHLQKENKKLKEVIDKSIELNKQVIKDTKEIFDIDTEYGFFEMKNLGESTRVNDLIKADLIEKVDD